MTGVLDVLEIRNPSLRERLLAVDPGAAEDETPAPAAGIELDGAVLGAGELAPWLAEHGGQPLGVATVDTWALGTGTVTEIALAAAGGAAAWFDPAELDEGDEQAFAAWIADAERPKVMHNAKSAMRVFPEHGWQVDGVTMDTALAAYLVKPGRRSFALDALAVEYLGRELAPAAASDGQLAFGADDQAEADALMTQARAVWTWGTPSPPGSPRSARPSCCMTWSCRRPSCWPAWSGMASPRTGPIWKAWSSSSPVRCSRR